MNAKEMWDAFSKKHHPGTDQYEAWAFGDDPDALAELVCRGTKTATASAYALYQIDNEPLPAVGDCSVILDSHGEARCIIRNTRVYIVPFDHVSADHAFKEGEGDRSLTHWRDVHKRFFTAELTAVGLSFSETMDVVCEEFEVIYGERI